jgi:hypothetical protein
MTEAEWLASNDVTAMYVFLRDTTTLFRTRWHGFRAVPRFAFGERKSRLFAVACCRRVLHLMPTDEARDCVLAAELFADGRITADQLSGAVDVSMRSCEQDWRRRRSARVPADRRAHEREVLDALGRVHRQESARSGVIRASAEAWAHAALIETTAIVHGESFAGQYRALVEAEFARQAGLLRDVVGNPFRPSAIDPAWLAWNDRCVERLARLVYEEHAFDRLPILHDALLDAGCDDERVLAHCRPAEGHVRGCWVLDLLLGQE